jgi:Protein of unknown function (DUF3987)/Bifunctional DNA primase/polymerase, N-terminal
MSVQDVARNYIARGWAPIPIPHKEKAPRVKRWQELRIGATDVVEYFNGHAQNIGVLLGAPSRGLVDIDLDHPRAVELADEYLPPTEAVFGREGNPRSHWLYVVATSVKTAKRKGRDGTIVELRSDGAQTVFPGSTHPSGEAVEWDSDGAPATVEAAVLVAAVERLAAAVRAETEPKAEPQRSATAAKTRHTPSDAVERCRGYLEKCPDAISGNAGHDAAFRAACECARFGLANDETWDVMAEYNTAKCAPPWSDSELHHKIETARERVEADGEFGLRLNDARPGRQDDKGAKNATGQSAAKRRRPKAEAFRPFPVDALPPVLATFITETAAALGCDEAMVAPPVLAATASAIGTTRAIALKESWVECPIVWTCVCARSGTLKSPAHDAAVKPILDAQDVARARHAQQSKTKADENSAGNLADLDAPPPPRYIMADTTIEAVAPILLANRRGVLVARDELAAWLRSPNQYKSKGGSDVAGWLELWRGGTLIVDRKTSGPHVYVRRAAVSVCGTIQPSVLASVLTDEYFESGFAARLLIVRPPTPPKRWTDRVPSDAAVTAYERTIDALLALDHLHPETGPEPVRLPMTPGAKIVWREWFDSHAQRTADAETDRVAAALAKIEAYAARFALIITLAENPDATVVDADAIRRGCILADWFAAEAARVYSLMSETAEDRDRRRLIELIQRRGGSLTVRELQQSRRLYNTADEAEAALTDLVKAGVGTWASREPTAKGGRPTRVFRLKESPPVYETPKKPQESVGSVDVDSIDEPTSDPGDDTSFNFGHNKEH